MRAKLNLQLLVGSFCSHPRLLQQLFGSFALCMLCLQLFIGRFSGYPGLTRFLFSIFMHGKFNL